MCQPGHLTRPLEPYVRELLRKGTRINSSPGTKRRDPRRSSLMSRYAPSQMNCQPSTMSEATRCLLPKVNSEWLGPACADPHCAGSLPHGL